jgi:ABC-type dipeptide/oligopeptide/nickel transport system permease component
MRNPQAWKRPPNYVLFKCSIEQRVKKDTMIQFLIKRFIGLLFVLLGVTFITFTLGHFAPGDPIALMLGQHFDPVLYARLRHQYGLDQPFFKQYYDFITHLAQLNFGYSYKYQSREVWDILKDGVPTSVELGLWALFVQVMLGVPLGIVSARKANTWIDTANQAVMLIIFAIPVFIFAILLQVVILQLDKLTGYQWPVANWGNPWRYSWTDIQFKLVPILVIALPGLAYYARLTRTSVMEALRQDYVRTARAKGMSERVVIYCHTFRNAMIPLVTIIGVSLGFLVTGAFFIETIYNIPGIAFITVQSIANRDYPVIQATTVMLAICVVVANVLADIMYTVVDPRIKAQ